MTTEETQGAAQTADRPTTTPTGMPIRYIASDGCVVHIDRVIEDGEIRDAGVEFYPHRGQAIGIVPVTSMREYIAISKVAGRTQAQGPVTAESMDRMGEAFATICEEIAGRVVWWDWTDSRDGTPLPQPFKRPAVIERLLDDEVVWLLTASKGESQEARGNGSTASPDGSLPRVMPNPSP